MIRWFIEKVAAWCERRGRVFNITGTGGHDDVYLTRYYVVKSKWLNVFIHRFMRSDRDDLHDHPWDFCTYLVSGAYTETKWNPERRDQEITRRANYCTNKAIGAMFRKNRLVFRRAEDQHKVEVDRPYQKGEEALAPLTVCITGPQRREWGFIRQEPLVGAELIAAQIDRDLYAPDEEGMEFVKRVWVDWRVYLGLDKDTPGRG